MRLRRTLPLPSLRSLTLLLSCLSLISTVCTLAAAKKSGPTITRIKLDTKPGGLFYFEDSEVILLYNHADRIITRSKNAGESWDTIVGVPDGKAHHIFLHPLDDKTAYVLSMGFKHYKTHDRGESWTEFETAVAPSLWHEPLIFHGSDPKSIIFQGQVCRGFLQCDEVALYTVDGFTSEAKQLRLGSRGCSWAKSTAEFSSGVDDIDARRTLCVSRGRYSADPKEHRLLMSDNFFQDHFEPNMSDGQPVLGIVSMAAVKKFIVAASKAPQTAEMALYVTHDTKMWHKAEFGDHRVEEDAYTVLESTNYSIQVDVMTTSPSTAMGVLFTSNSNGTYFTRNLEHTNRNRDGLVDFEKVQGIQGIALVNTVENWEQVIDTTAKEKHVVSSISFDDGRNFQELRTKEKERLHLHSVTNMHNMGRVFTSPAPGIIMGIGNTGKHLKPYKDGGLWVSDDAGVSWWKGQDKAHKYAFGDQGSILVAVSDEEVTDKIVYSLDHGHVWETAELGEKVRAGVLSTARDSTSLKFLLIGVKEVGEKEDFFSFAIDFQGLHERKCTDSDFEKWYARVDADGKPSCLMGHKQFYRRRKADADCLIDVEYKDPQPESEGCDCAEHDFECDFNFVKDGDKCVPARTMAVPEGTCRKSDESFLGSSGYRLIPGNDCKRQKGAQKDDEVKRPCQEGSVKAPADGNISHKLQSVDGTRLLEFFHLERTASSVGDDETIVMRTSKQEVFITHDHGKTWKSMKKDFDGEDIIGVYPNEYFNDMVYFLTKSKTVYYTTNRGYKIHKMEAPQLPNEQHLRILRFHPSKRDWLIWTGAKDCDGRGSDCHSVAFVSTDRGDGWELLRRYVGKCQFIWAEGRGSSTNMADQLRREKLIYCEQHAGEDLNNPKQLVASDDFFQRDAILFKDVVSFATMSEFVVVAANSATQKTLQASTSVDGQTFAEALFPPDFVVPRQQAYTVLDSATHAIFMHVTVSTVQDAEYGSLLKSNSNGTFYVTSLDGVNRNSAGYVDFEKMQGLEGVALVNVVDNVEEARKRGLKKLRTMITHNDGAEWSLIAPPPKDAKGDAWSCNGPIAQCALHLHGYTERDDPRDTYSSPSAIGMMMAVGNVGSHLSPVMEADTFFSGDGGITWQNVQKGAYRWEYGDQGSIIVIVKQLEPTNVVRYTIDEGRTWKDYQFADSAVLIDRISTVPSDSSRNFLLWSSASPGEITTINLDFTGLTDKVCRLEENHPEDGDYTLWQPKHPMQQDNCLFGHVAEYHRKRPDVLCYNANKPIDHLHFIAKNCSCTRQDYECDFNFARLADGSCRLVPGFSPPDHSESCRARVPEGSSAPTHYYIPTGYRRIPLSTCQGGHELEYLESKAQACPGFEKEFAEHRRVSGWVIFISVLVPFALAGAAGWWVWRHWDGKFGRIRLGEGGAGVFEGAGGAAGNALMHYTVVTVAVLVAVITAIPDIVRRMWRFGMDRLGRSASARYTTRSSFSRDRGDYAEVENDEGELLGEDSDEEV